MRPPEIGKQHGKYSDLAITCITILCLGICLFPIINIVALSFSSNSAILASRVTLFPVEFTTQSYQVIFADKSMLFSMFFTVMMTIIYTIIAMLLTTFCAYPLTKKRLKGRNFFLVVIIITMYFSGGLIPDYLLVRDLHLLDTIWSLILPGVLSAFNMLILKSFFITIPDSFEESAILDGCNDLQILFRITIPLSTPVLATLALFYAVGKWNGFMDALFYISSPILYPLQLKLYQIIVNSTSLDVAATESSMSQSILLPESIKAACVVFATVPVLLIYPWLQKYFAKGVMIGAIKG